MKRWMMPVLCLALCGALAGGCGAGTREEDQDASGAGRLKIMTTVFPAYDFARAAAGELADVTLLLPPGVESHTYEPTPADIIAVSECDLFLYLGGESDAWVDTILSAVEPAGQVMRMVDCVELLEEEVVEGMEDPDHAGHDHEEEASSGLGQVVGMDEHVWTSPRNAARIVVDVGEQLAQIDPGHAGQYQENAAAYAAEIDALDQAFAAFFEGLDSRAIVFGDRFPLLYFAREFDLDYYAAFPGCGTQTEPSAATIAFLIEKVQEEHIPVVWYIEFSNHLVADSIAEATGTHTALFHTCHNVTQAEMDAGATYLSLMEGNLAALRQNLVPSGS